jgi:hypothetical protein
LRHPHRRRLPGPLPNPRDPLSGLELHLQSFTRAPPQAIRSHAGTEAPSMRVHPPHPRFGPLQRLPDPTEPHTSGESHLHRSCCALRVSHPLDALLPARSAGLVSSRYRSWGSPFEALILSRSRTPSRTPLPSWSWLAAPKRCPPSCRAWYTTKSPVSDLGFSQDPATGASLGFVPSRVSCSREWSRGLPRFHPLSRFIGPVAS